MNNKLIHVGLVVALAAGCGGRSARSGDQQQFETVQEGSASGVTTTIRGPGETLPPITGTNADTTTDFALDPNAIATDTATGTEMGAYSTALNEGAPISTSPSYTPATAPPSPALQPTSSQASRPAASTPARPRRVEPAPQPERPAQPEPADQPETDTSTTTVAPRSNPAPPPTTTSPEPPQTDTEAEEPPPPTTTTTNGDGSSDRSHRTSTQPVPNDGAQ